MANIQRVILFGGQGSHNLFSRQSFSTAITDARSSSGAAILVSRCHAAFLEDLQSLENSKSTFFGTDSDIFVAPETLLAPDSRFHDNPIIQGTTICLHQLLRYLSHLSESNIQYESAFEQIVETAGFCSGILPAVVVASSRSLQEFVDRGVEAFRIAFWTGFRSAVYCEKSLGRCWKDVPWSLVIFGLKEDQISTHLQEFRRQSGCHSLNIAVISSDTCITLSGPGPDLSAFKQFCSTASSAKFAHVHALYHGGEHMQSVAQEVLKDLTARHIKWVSFADLKTPIRSTLDGSLHAVVDEEKQSFLKCVLYTLLVDTVNWRLTSEKIHGSINNRLEKQSELIVELQAFGPSSGFLLSEVRRRQQHPRMRFLDSPHSAASQLPTEPDIKGSIAIVGIAVNYPKGKGVENLWDTLSQGLSAIEEVHRSQVLIPDSRFKLSQFHEPEPSKAKGRKMTAKHGNFIDDVWSFDHSFFNISSREAKSMDPQSRILLQAAHAAMEDAGYTEDSTPTFQRDSFGCYIGVATGDYTDNLRDDIDVYYSPGTLRAFLSGKISYNYKMSGPSVVVDTACSSSLVAIYQACRALQNGDCSSALAGGVNVITSPDMYLGLARAHFLSPTGQCKSFDAGADGYSRAEGCGVFVLKRLSDAVAENDRIHGIIKGIEVNQSGLAHSITHPHPETQARLFKSVLKRAEVEPNSISVVEAHGTGTQAGDFSEISSLNSVFARGRNPGDPLVVSSIKGNIGHCEAASGAAGLAKLLLMLRHGKIPKQASLDKLNPKLPRLLGDDIIIPRKALQWEQSSRIPRRALLNNFGAAGSNVALVLEDFVERESQDVSCTRSSYIFNVSARSQWALQELVQLYRRHLKERGAVLDIRDICYTATARRQDYEHRISFTCSSVDDLLEQLEKVRLDQSRDNKRSKPLLFVFSGQGASYFGMGQELMETSESFRETVEHCDNIITELGCSSVVRLLQSKDGTAAFPNESEQVVSFQCACVIVEYALAKLWMSWNIIPDMVLGHSLGEYPALIISGAISLKDALRVVAHRAKLMTTTCRARSSGMVACKFSTERAEGIFTETAKFPDLTVACQNSSRDCVVAGPLEQLTEFGEHCSATGHKTTKLQVPYGFHSKAMDPVIGPLKKLGDSVEFSEPKIPIVSNVFGRRITGKDLGSDYFANHARQPVRFVDSIRSLQEVLGSMDQSLFLEIGPHPITLPMIRAMPGMDTCMYLPTLYKGRGAWSSMSASLRQIYPTRDGIQWRRIFSGTGASIVDIPGHPLAPTEAVVPYEEIPSAKVREDVASSDSKTRFTLLPNFLNSKSSMGSYCFETYVSLLAKYISGHVVAGIAMCPASVFHELVLEAIESARELTKDMVYVVKEITFANPLVYNVENEHQPVHVLLEEIPSTPDMGFMVVSKAYGSRAENLHCSGVISKEQASHLKSAWTRQAALVKRQKAHLFAGHGDDLDNFHTRVLYKNVFSRVVEYSKEYQTLVSISVSESSGEAFGSFTISDSSATEQGISSPTFTDTLLHAAGFVANTSIRTTDVCICGEVESVQVLYWDIDYKDTFTVYCSLFDNEEGTVLADAYALNSSGNVVATIEGMHFKKLRLSSFRAMLERLVGKSEVSDGPEPVEAIQASANPTVSHPTSQSMKEEAAQLQNKKAKVSRIILESCELPENQAKEAGKKELKALGVDSLMLLELVSAIKSAFPDQPVDESTLMQCSSIQELEDSIMGTYDTPSTTPGSDTPENASSNTSISKTDAGSPSLKGSGVQETESGASPILLQRNASSKPSLFLFHDGSGLSNMYSQIQGLECNLYGFFNPGFHQAHDQPSSLIEMATRYKSNMDTSDASSLVLGGYSFGGVVAFETTRQLQEAGKQVKGLVLIDSPHPIDHEPLPQAIIAHITRSGSAGDSPSSARQRVSAQFEANAALLRDYRAPAIGMPFPKVVMLRSQDTLDCENLCGVRYPWLSDEKARSESIRAWENLVGQEIQVFDIPGNHFDAFAPQNITAISRQIRNACDAL